MFEQSPFCHVSQASDWLVEKMLHALVRTKRATSDLVFVTLAASPMLSWRRDSPGDISMCSTQLPCWLLFPGLNGEVEYSITGGDTEGCFAIGSRDGVIRTARPLDRETQATYNLAISATDLAPREVDRLTTSAMVRAIFSWLYC